MAQEEAEYLLKKANQLCQEKEDEIKYLNEVLNSSLCIELRIFKLKYLNNQLILNAKVQTIRDAQIEEKHHIRKEVKEEDKRLDIMMEVDRLNSIKIQEEIEKKRKQDLQE